MHTLLQLLSEYQLEVETRAFAHYSSSKYHRRQGVLWGIAASGFTGFASLAALAGGALKLGASTMFETRLGTSGLFVMGFSAIVLFALATASALEAFLAHPKQAASHMASYAGYSHAMRRLETLRLRCANLSNGESELGALLSLLDEISQEIKDVAAASIYPLPKAYRVGKTIKQSDSEFKKEWEKTFGPRSSTIKSRIQSEA